jgi:2-methylcitrate dehydratase
MTFVERLAGFAARASFVDLSAAAQEQIKLRVLDSLGCAIGALGADLARRVRAQVTQMEGTGACSLLGGGRAAPDRAALLNGALVRYLDFNDSYLAKGETCHPSDNLAPVLAAVEMRGGSGRDLLTALAVAYQVQCRLSDVAPLRAKGFDHTTQGSLAVAAGVSKALDLDHAAAANAAAICATAFNSLRVTRTGRLSSWKGLAYPAMASCCVNAALLAKNGITGPPEAIEGEKGFMSVISGPFEIDWSQEDLERVLRTSLKKHNAEVHSQTTLEALLELRHEHPFRPEEVARVQVEVFDAAYQIIGGGEEGERTTVTTKEQADHSLPYLSAVAILDGQVMPEQFEASRILRSDVQSLLRRVIVRPEDALTSRFPEELPSRVAVVLQNGQTLEKELDDYPGYYRRPMSWQQVREKFERLSEPCAQRSVRDALAEAVANLENIPVSELTRLFSQVHPPQPVRER